MADVTVIRIIDTPDYSLLDEYLFQNALGRMFLLGNCASVVYIVVTISQLQ